MYLKNIKI